MGGARLASAGTATRRSYHSDTGLIDPCSYNGSAPRRGKKPVSLSPSKKSQKQQATRERSARNKNRREANEQRLKAKRQRASELGSRSRKAVDAETRSKGKAAAAPTKPARRASLTPGQREAARAAARRIEPSAADLERSTSRDQMVDQHLQNSSPSRAIFANQSRSAAVAMPLFAICGRPNVGKSTLFNRLTGSRRSIVGDEPGITRDRIYGEVEWAGRTARLVDTGGIVPDDPNLIPSEIFRQARTALEEAEAIVMVV
ncbi:MAG TPA: GTPase, partial [Steroidobacteraceae bacterium]